MIDGQFNVTVLISGRGSNLEAILSYQKAQPTLFRVVGVVSDKDSAKGLEIAKSHGLPTRVVTRRTKEISSDQFNQELIEAVSSFHPDLVVLAGYMRIVDPCFVGAFQKKIINIHPSLLPSFRGLHAQQQALTAGVRVAGCTVHFVTQEMDAGPIIAQAAVPVFANDSVEMLSERILTREHFLLPRVIQLIAEGKVTWEREGFRDRVVVSNNAIETNEVDNSIVCFG